MPSPLRIATIAGRSVISAAITRGLANYAQSHGLPWVLINIDPHQIDKGEPSVRTRLAASYDGVAGFLDNSTMAWAATKDCPIIQYARMADTNPRTITINGDDEAIGTMAARHLLEQGYRSFACIGRWGIEIIARRCDAFIAELAGQGHGCAIEDQDANRPSTSTVDPEADLAAWIASLPQPVALFYHQDRPALYACELCASAGLRVPEQVAILGVDDISDACEASQPPLSSVALPWFHMGELGARHLHRMLGGGAGGETILIPPTRVAARASTKRPRISDPLAARCMRFLEKNFGRTIRAPQVAADLGVDARTLHRHLITATGSSLSDHLHRLRITQARELLATTDLPIAEVAIKVGYANRQRFGAMFRKLTGISPTNCRVCGNENTIAKRC